MSVASVLKIIAELQSEQEVVSTGLIKKEIRRKGLGICERSLNYYLHNFESDGLIELKFIRKNKGRTRKVKLNIPREWIS
jgi:repressor of nif and glnA expression